MTATKNDAIAWIDTQDTGFCRTNQERAKYLVGKLIAAEIPHPAIWWWVLKISKGIA